MNMVQLLRCLKYDVDATGESIYGVLLVVRAHRQWRETVDAPLEAVPP
jgi:hypothetical protein